MPGKSVAVKPDQRAFYWMCLYSTLAYQASLKTNFALKICTKKGMPGAFMDSARQQQHLSLSNARLSIQDSTGREADDADDMDVDERDLIAMAVSNTDAFRSLYRRYVPRVYGYIASRVDAIQDAEDLTAETFLKILKGLRHFEYRGQGSFAAWVFRIALNQVNGFHRRSPPKPQSLEVIQPIASDHPVPEEWLAQQEQASRVREMLTMLSPRRQEIITLRFYGGLRNQEIAVVLGLNERSVAAHLSRALADLQQRYRTTNPDSEFREEG
jgi:RNA polymerase sigma-70 factor, ECF subfamily